MPLGVNLGSLTKVLKCAKDDDMVTIKAGDDADVLNLTYEAKSECFFVLVFRGKLFRAYALLPQVKIIRGCREPRSIRFHMHYFDVLYGHQS